MPGTVAQRVADNLWNLLEEHDCSQSELARHLGVNQPTVSRWLHGTYNVSLPNLERIAEYFGTTVADLVEAKPQVRGEHDSVSSAPVGEPDKQTRLDRPPASTEQQAS